MLNDKIRVFSSDNIELAPCHIERAESLVRRNKAYFIVINTNERIVVLIKTTKQIKRESGDRK